MLKNLAYSSLLHIPQQFCSLIFVVQLSYFFWPDGCNIWMFCISHWSLLVSAPAEILISYFYFWSPPGNSVSGYVISEHVYHKLIYETNEVTNTHIFSLVMSCLQWCVFHFHCMLYNIQSFGITFLLIEYRIVYGTRVLYH